MVKRDLSFQLNQPDVVAEIFGDEIIAIHLKRGCYYSIEQSGASIWRLAIAGANVREIIADIHQSYTGDRTEIQQHVQRFLDELQAAELIVPVTNGVHSATHVATTHPPTNPIREPFVPPSLAEYTDMQELLLLDPIHDVDERGWPLQKVT